MIATTGGTKVTGRPYCKTLSTMMALSLLGCVAEVEPEADPQIYVQELDEGRFLIESDNDSATGLYRLEGYTLAVDVQRQDDVVWASIGFDERASFSLSIDMRTGELTHEGFHEKLTARDLEAIDSAFEVLVGHADEMQNSAALSFMGSFMNYMTELPEDPRIPAIRREFDAFKMMDSDEAMMTMRSSSNDGIKCIKKDKYYRATWYGDTYSANDAPTCACGNHGNYYCNQWDVHTCHGLCGENCQVQTIFAMWTLDCLEHDSCRHANGGNGTNEGCGDEFNEAADDFLAGGNVINPCWFCKHCNGSSEDISNCGVCDNDGPNCGGSGGGGSGGGGGGGGGGGCLIEPCVEPIE